VTIPEYADASGKVSREPDEQRGARMRTFVFVWIADRLAEAPAS
jgi:hypothetical protein